MKEVGIIAETAILNPMVDVALLDKKFSKDNKFKSFIELISSKYQKIISLSNEELEKEIYIYLISKSRTSEMDKYIICLLKNRKDMRLAEAFIDALS